MTPHPIRFAPACKRASPRRGRGFTMIELVVVIVLLGILSAAALPRFLDLRSDSELAAMQRLSSSLSSAAAMNLARCQITANVADGVKCIAVSNCTDVGGLLEGGLPAASQPGTSIYIVSQSISTTANGASANCTVRLDDSSGTARQSQVFQGITAGH